MHTQYEPILDAEIVLGDGRKLAYAVWGDPDGETAFLFHGAPGSRFVTPDPDTTAKAGVRLVTVDRPGYGRSDPDPARQILDWPNDVLQLADALQAARFAVVAHSSGGPYALASTLKMPDRVSVVALISCVAPYDEVPAESDDEDRALTRLAQQDPDRGTVKVAEGAAWLVADPERFLDLPRPEPDARLLANEAIRTMFVSAVREAVRQGIDAYAWDCVLERRPWGFTLADVDADVSIWQGEQDVAVLRSQADALVGGLSRGHMKLVPDAGHWLILSRWAEILSDLKGSSSL